MNITRHHLRLGFSLPSLLFLVLLHGTALAQSLTSVTLTPSTVPGGQPSNGLVSLSAAAPAGGVLVTLSSSNPGVALTPAFTLVPAGATTSAFTVTTQPVASNTAVTVSAAFSGVTRTATLTVERTPPTALLIGAYILTGATYTASDWDPAQNRWTDATGDGVVILAADGESHPIAVHFASLTIVPVGAGTGNVTGGSATYTPPGAPPQPESIGIAGFTLLLDGLTIAPTSAVASGRLRLPASIVDAAGGQCQPGTLDLGTFSLTPSCQFYVAQTAGPFGPWILGPHGMSFSGVGFEADFSLSQSPILTPPVPLDFRGLVLKAGSTAPAVGPVISNTGYLQAQYSFADAVVVAAGMKTVLQLAAEFQFNTLEPWGYWISIRAGHLNVNDSVVTGGAFVQLNNGGIPWGEIGLPPRAVLVSSWGTPVIVSYSLLEVQPDLDLSGEVSFTAATSISWGELGDTGNPRHFYGCGPLSQGRFYLSATPRPTFWPVDSSGKYKNILFSNTAAQLEAEGMQGVTFRVSGNTPGFIIRTPDTPSAQDIILTRIAPRSWLNVGARGVHADISSEHRDADDPLDLLVGPNHLPSYVPPNGDGEPFSVTLETIETVDRRYTWLFQFVESAVHRSDMNGKVHLGFPASTDLDFQNMRFTSTAHNTGARIEIYEPVALGYWDLDLVPKQIAATAAAMCVKTGQIFLTAAGIQEPRHFARPFFLLWGEMLANGHVGNFVFDHNASGQEFDGFPFVPEVVALSEVAVVPDAEAPYLHVAGTAHFDFFGDQYLDIRDHRDDDHPTNPHDGRSISLAGAGEHGSEGTDFHVTRAWDGDFGSLDYMIKYDELDQDGFVSDDQFAEANRFEVTYVDLPLAASLDLKRDRACVSIHEEQNRAVALPLLIDIGTVKRITGCGCIEDGVLKQLVLSSELATNFSGGLLHTAGYVGVEKVFTPTTSEFSLSGQAFLNVTGSGDVDVIGQVHFLLDREHDFFEGEVKGKIDASSYLGFASLGGLSAEGQLSWHVGSLANGGYQLLQGMVAVNVVAPAGAAGIGVEGGFLVGANAPREKAWVIIGTDPRFKTNLDMIPPLLTGVFGYAKVSTSINAYVISGGFDAYMGVGGFISPENLHPVAFGHMNASIWGEFLGGLVSATAWLDAQLSLPLAPPGLDGTVPKFQGSVGVEVCAVWVICAAEQVTMTVDEKGINFSN